MAKYHVELRIKRKVIYVWRRTLKDTEETKEGETEVDTEEEEETWKKRGHGRRGRK